MLHTLFLNPPSYEGFDGGAGSRYQAKREIRSYWYPTWLAQPAALVPGSRLVDVQHAVLPTRLPLHRFYEELVKTQAVLARKHLGFAALAKTTGIIARQLIRGQTNFARMIWKFDQVYHADRQYAEHQREARYLLPPPTGRAAAPPDRNELFVHVPVRRRPSP